jgi:hypothetical protein
MVLPVPSVAGHNGKVRKRVLQQILAGASMPTFALTIFDRCSLDWALQNASAATITSLARPELRRF